MHVSQSIPAAFISSTTNNWTVPLRTRKLTLRHSLRGALVRTGLAACKFGRNIGIAQLFSSLDHIEEAATRQLQHDDWPVQPVRIGAPKELVVRLAELVHDPAVRFICVDDHNNWDHHNLDAYIYHPAPLRIEVYTPEHKSASEFEWDLPSRLTYSRVFPLRLDSGCWDCDDNENELTLIGLLTFVSALMSRSHARADVYDVIKGRYLPPHGVGMLTEGREVVLHPDVISEAIEQLVTALRVSLHTSVTSPSDPARVAARLVSAWAASDTVVARADIRIEAATIAATILHGEPAVLLRACAVHVAYSDDALAIDALNRAFDSVTGANHDILTEDLAHLQAEATLGESDSLTVGRIAAGLVLTLAPKLDSQSRYMVEDFIDEALNSSVFLGRDQDIARMKLVRTALFERAFPAGQKLNETNRTSASAATDQSTVSENVGVIAKISEVHNEASGPQSETQAAKATPAKRIRKSRKKAA